MYFTVVSVLALTFFAYWQVAHNEFIDFDDLLYIASNPHVNTGLSWDNVKWAFARSYADNWHPLTWISHMLDVQLFGLEPAGHHLMNLALHLVNTVLLFWFLMRTTGLFWQSIFVAGLFALHPLHVESVAWASERKDTLSTLFWLGTMLAYASYARKPAIWRYLMVVALFALGLMAKQMLVTLPLVLLLLDFWPLERFSVYRWRFITDCGQSMKRIFLEKVPLLALSASAAAITMHAQHAVPADVAPFVIRLLNAIISYGRYLAKMVWPANLSAHYLFFHTPTVWIAGPVLLFLLTVTIAALTIGRSRRYVLTGWLWYLGTLVPVIGLVHVGLQSHADRYTYVPLIGIFIVIVFALGDIAEKRPLLRKVLGIGGVAVLLALAAVTWKTVAYWKDDVRLFRRATEIQPENVFIRSALGKNLMKRQRYDEARVELLIANSIRPHPQTLGLLALTAQEQNRYDEALDYFKKAFAFRKPSAFEPVYGPVYIDAGLLLYEMGRYDEAEKCLREAVTLDQGSANAHRLLAMVLAKKGDYAGAAMEYKNSLEIEQDFSAWNNLGDAQENMQDLAAAEQSYRRAIAMDPESSVAQYNLGSVLSKLCRKEEAIAAVARAIALDPNDTAARALHEQLTADP